MDEAKAALEHALASSELFGAPLLIVANKQVMAPEIPAVRPACNMCCTAGQPVDPVICVQDRDGALSGTVVSDHLGEATLRAHRPCR